MTFDFLKGPGNISVDLVRLGSATAFILYPMPYVYISITKGIMPDASFGSGYALVIAAIGGAIFAKDIGVAKANSVGGSS